MTMTTITRRTELAHRRSEGIDVYLFWNEPTSRVTVGRPRRANGPTASSSRSTDATRSTPSTSIKRARPD